MPGVSFPKIELYDDESELPEVYSPFIDERLRSYMLMCKDAWLIIPAERRSEANDRRTFLNANPLCIRDQVEQGWDTWCRRVEKPRAAAGVSHRLQISGSLDHQQSRAPKVQSVQRLVRIFAMLHATAWLPCAWIAQVPARGRGAWQVATQQLDFADCGCKIYAPTASLDSYTEFNIFRRATGPFQAQFCPR